MRTGRPLCSLHMLYFKFSPDAEFLDVFGTKVLTKNFPSCYSQSSLLMDLLLPPTSPEQKWFETGL
jgi:hypothetical protein